MSRFNGLAGNSSLSLAVALVAAVDARMAEKAVVERFVTL
jgi:hypothetical protein